jgi:hypothetical protein
MPKRVKQYGLALVGVGVAVGVIAPAVMAAGNFDTFTAKQTFSPNAAGSTSHPVPLGFKQLWTAKGNNPTGNAAPLTKIVAKAYGIQYNGGKFPKCTASQINNAGVAHNWNAVCPHGSLIAEGPIKAVLSPAAGGRGVACDPYIKMYNGGATTQTFFFTLYPQAPGRQYECASGGVHTGTGCAAYTGHLSHSGKTAILTIPLPGCASTNAGNIGLYAALQVLNVTYKKLTKKVHGKTIGYTQSVACKGGQRPWSFAFTAQNFKGKLPHTMTQIVSGKQAC